LVNVLMAIDFKIFPWKIKITYVHRYGFFTDFTFMCIAITHLKLLLNFLPNNYYAGKFSYSPIYFDFCRIP